MNTPGRGRNLTGGPDIASIAAAADMADRSAALGRILDSAIERIHSDTLLAPISAQRMERSLRSFGGFLVAGRGLDSLSNVRPAEAEAFIRAPDASGRGPAVPTMHHRRSALRLLFRLARVSGWASTDPTLDIELPARSSLPCRAFTNDEVALCRSWSVSTLRETRGPATWALAETGARTSELPHLLVSDVDLGSGRVWIHGSPRQVPRWGELTDWGREQVSRRVAAVKAEAAHPLVYEGRGGEAGQVSACIAIAATLRRAGLASEPDVRPLSVAAWLGATLRRDGSPIEEIARRLGMRSLDRTARLIGWDWSSEDRE